MSNVVLREPNYLAGDAYAIPRGLECVFEFNGFKFNDKRLMDAVIVTKIGGLDDPDVRDSREVNPDRDGETPFDAVYDGRTLTFQGYIRAGSLARLRELNGLLKAAFDTLVERPLYFRYHDWDEAFTESQALLDFTVDSGTGLSVSTGGLVPASTALKRIVLSAGSRLTYTDAETIIKVTPNTAANQTIMAVMARSAATTYLGLGFEAGVLKVKKVITGTPTNLVTGSTIAPPTQTPYWVVGRKVANVVSAEYWTTDPALGGTATSSVTPTTLAGGDIAQFGAAVSGLAGLEWTPVTTSDRLQLLDIGAINPGDAYVSCRKLAKFESEEVQDGYEFRRDFLLTVRASNPLFVSRKSVSTTLTPVSNPLTFPAGGAGLAFLAPDIDLVFTVAGATATITNMGRSPASTVVRFTGPISNPNMLNVTNGTRSAITGDIASGDYLELDSATRRVVDAAGVSRYSLLSDDTTWMTLESGANTVQVATDTVAGTATVTHKHSNR